MKNSKSHFDTFDSADKILIVITIGILLVTFSAIGGAWLKFYIDSDNSVQIETVKQ
jgi:hypothetical protein